MRRALPLVLACALALAACVAAPGGRAPTDAGKRSATPKPAASRTVAPASTAPAGAGPAKASGLVAAALRRPAGATVPLAGEVRLDASYMVAAGAGNVISHNGGLIVAAGGLNLIGADGATLIGNDGGTLIGNDGGTLIGADGGTLIGADGGSLIGNDGGTLVAAGGGNIVAAGAGNMIVPGGGAAGARAPVDASGNLVPAGGGAAGYRLAQASSAPPSPPSSASPSPGAGPLAGDQLPAAGLLVSVVRLRDHAYLPLGVDARGEPVYAVYSNARGGYEVWIPAEERGNVAIVTGVPGQADYRLTLNRVAEPAAGGALAVDEVSALAARYLRLSITSRLAAAMQHPDLAVGLLEYERAFAGAPDAASDAEPPVGTPYWRVVAAIRQIAAIARAAGFTEESPEAAWRVAAQGCVDASIGRVPLRELVTRVGDLRYTEHVVEGRPVLETFEESTRVAHDGATKLLRERPDAFAQAYLEGTINAPAPNVAVMAPIGDWTGRIRKPADVGEYMLVEYFSATRLGVVEPLRRLYASFYGALGEPDAQGEADKLVANGRAAGYTLLVTLARELQGPVIRPDGTPDAPNAAFEAELRAICERAASE